MAKKPHDPTPMPVHTGVGCGSPASPEAEVISLAPSPKERPHHVLGRMIGTAVRRALRPARAPHTTMPKPTIHKLG